MTVTPFDKIKKSLSDDIPSDLLNYLPEKWEKIGNVLIIKLSKKLTNYKNIISREYAKNLICKTILNDVGGISGEYRKPNFELLFGLKNSETVHVENGVKFKLDPQQIMFSSGNMDERIRMSLISNTDEIVVDLFAGIGYFSIPLAIYSKPQRVYSCEINPVAYNYLCDNIVLNNVTSIVQPMLGDNKIVAPKDVANRVTMGFIDKTYKYLPTAINCLKNNTGIIHYHDVYPKELVPKKPIKTITEITESIDVKANVLKYHSIKSYAPGINHYVFDIELVKNE